MRRDRTTGNISIVSVPESTGGGLRIKEINERWVQKSWINGKYILIQKEY